ncbi:MAG: BatA and WFA domain-containing protein [Planctomycetaceae bacterium]|nr:BatA and WFA domain-containing protein [Planctomycetaceae bacterium]
MSWLTSWIPNFFTPSSAWLFSLLIPIIVFYFLKLRRTRLEVSSLALWRQVINDQRVNAPFQRFKRNILLFLQLALLCLIALAAMQPFFPGDAERLQYLPILIDCSASMAATDAEGKTRLELAKEEVAEIIEGLMPGQQLTLISVGNSARRLTDFTDNKPVLREALESIEIVDVPSKIEDGLRLSQALARTHEIEKIRFYSDGNLPTRINPATGKPMAAVNFDLPFAVDFFQMPAAGNNMGITALNARRANQERWDVFLRVEGTPSGSTESRVVLMANGQVAGEDRVILGPGESQRLVFGVPADAANHLVAKLEPIGADALEIDNRAWLDLPAAREITVYCPPELLTFRHALESLEGVRVEPAGDGAADRVAYDLVISDQADDQAREAPVVLMVGTLPDDLTEMITILEEPAEVVDFQRDAQLLQHVQLKDVIISESPEKKEGVEDPDIEQLGYTMLAYGNRGPLILRQRDGTKVTYFLLFHTDRSTLPYRVGFPVLVNNLLSEALQFASLGEMQAAKTGVLPSVSLTKNETYRVTRPDGKHEERMTNDDGLLVGVPASQIGEYEIRSEGNLVDKIGVGLLDPSETSLFAVDKIQFNELSVQAEDQKLKTDKPLWPKIAFAAFALLLFEWWYFQKRPAGIPD